MRKPTPRKQNDGTKLGATVARSIQDEIMSLGWPIGYSLGTERELLERFEVSRATLREAIRQIEGQGMAEMRCGVDGGLVVCAPARAVAVRTLATYLELIGAGFDEIIETRAILESFAARLAAKRLTDIGVEKLTTLVHQRQSLRRLDLAGCIRISMQMREMIGELSGNPAIVMLIEAFDRFAIDLGSPPRVRGAHHHDEIRRQLQMQDQLVDAILRRDGESAERISHDDILQGGQYSAGLFNGALPEPSLPAGLDARDGAPPHKLAQQLAIALAADIRKTDPDTGGKLGREPELQERYGVSRAVLREALRILELHGLTRTQRGNGGGIMVGVPDPGYTVESASLYLRCVQFSTASLYEVFRELDLAAVVLATRRADDAGVAALRETLTRQLALPGDDPQWVRAVGRFHELFGELSGNRVLALFLRVLIDTSVDARMFAMRPAVKDDYDGSHAGILRAIESRNEAQARKRLVGHLALAMRLR